MHWIWRSGRLPVSDKLLRKILDDFSSVPEDEAVRLIAETLDENSELRAIFDYLPEGHILVSKDHTVLLASHSVSMLLPSDRRGRIREGRAIDDVIIDRDAKAFLMDVLSGREKAEPKDFAFQHGDETRIIRVSFQSMHAGDLPLMDIIVKDITEDIRKEARLRRSESLASMTTMAAGIAHEIKNPLAAMKIHLQLMRKAFRSKGSLTEEMAERYLSVLDEEIDHLNSIAVDFLFAVRPMDIELMLGSINDVITDLVVFLKPEADEKGIEVRADLEKFLPRVELDARYMRQSLLNIVENAFSAMPGGGTLSITTKLTGDYITISIRDTGTGIDPEQLEKIFEPYFTTKASGTGLGLTVVYKVIKEHHGDIFVSSEIGKGTVFTIKLPVPQSQRKALENKEDGNGFTIDC